MTQERDTFLSRWSRLKVKGREPDAPQPAGQAPVDRPDPVNTDSVASPEEIAALPRIEDLTPESDISAFLRKGVPEMLRKAALRRIWALDPAIRDYVGDARDYAYDWNIPGNVPGNGPLLPTDDVEAMLDRVFNGSPRAQDAPAMGLLSPDDASQVSDLDGSHAPPGDAAPQPGSEVPHHAVPEDLAVEAATETGPSEEPAEEKRVALPSGGGRQSPPSPAFRRHGRANPV